MKTLILALIATLGFCSVAFAQDNMPTEDPAMPPGTFNHFYAPMQAYKVTVQSDNGVVSVLEVPQGVFLNVQAHQEQNPNFREETTMPRTFRGDIIIRTRRADEMQENESSAAHEIMAKAPLEMSLRNALVVVEKVLKPEQESEGER